MMRTTTEPSHDALFSFVERFVGRLGLSAVMVVVGILVASYPAWAAGGARQCTDRPLLTLSMEERWEMIRKRVGAGPPIVDKYSRPGKAFCLGFWSALRDRGAEMLVHPEVVAQSPNDPALRAVLGKCADVRRDWGTTPWRYPYHGSGLSGPPDTWPKKLRWFEATANLTVTRVTTPSGDYLVTAAGEWRDRDSGCQESSGFQYAVTPDDCSWKSVEGDNVRTPRVLIEYDGRTFSVAPFSWEKDVFLTAYEVSLEGKMKRRLCRFIFQIGK